MNPHGENSMERHHPMPKPSDYQGMEVDKHYYSANRMMPYSMYMVPPHPPPPPPQNQMSNPNDFRRDSSVCKACSRHVFRSDAVRCIGGCKGKNGEFHGHCMKMLEWTCGPCNQQKSISKDDLDKAVDDLEKNFAKTDAKITSLRADTNAGKIASNIEIDELKTQIQNMNIRFEFVEKQVNSLKAGVTGAMTEIKNAIGDLESKILVMGERSKCDKIDITGIQDTLNNACHVIVTEMSMCLDKLVQDKAKIVQTGGAAPKQTVDIKSPQSTSTEDTPRTPQNPRKTTRLQKLASQFGI